MQITDFTLTEIIKELKFDYVNSDITDTNFPKQEIRGTVEILNFNKCLSTKQVLERIAEKGCEVANIYELLEFAKKDWNKRDSIVALGSVWRGLVPYVNGCGDVRWLRMDSTECVWLGFCLFAVIKKDTVQQRKNEKIIVRKSATRTLGTSEERTLEIRLQKLEDWKIKMDKIIIC